MSRVVASLAAVLAIGLAACGDDGAEPGASHEATLVLDFQPNAVHAGIYTALAEGFLADEGVELEVRAPSASTDAPKLLAAGRAELAVMDIHDVAIALERGAEIRPLAPIVRRPLAAVITANTREVRRPRDLEGRTVGVTGLPSDDAALDSVVGADEGDPALVRRVTIGFDSVAALSAGRIDAATAFWNAEGVALRRLGVQTREFRVERFGAPRYPELVLVSSPAVAHDEPLLVDGVAAAIARGYEATVSDPDAALGHLLAAVDGLDAEVQAEQLEALMAAKAFETPVTARDLRRLVAWEARHGILESREPLDELLRLR